MVRILSLDVFINGTQMSEPDGDVPFRAIAAFVKRMMLDLTEPNSESEHRCSEDCRYYYELLIGTKELGGFENCAPRFLIISVNGSFHCYLTYSLNLNNLSQ